MSVDNDPSILLDHLHQAVLCINVSGRVNYCNESASLFWQRDSSRLRGTQAGRLFREDTLILDRLKQVFDDAQEFQLRSYELSTPPLENRIAEIVLTPLMNGAGTTEQVLITLLESTRFNTARQHERETEQAQDVGTLLSMLAHEIQNPLSGIKGMLQLLEGDLKDSGMDAVPTEMMFSEIERIERLLQQLLLHSHPMPLSPVQINLHELLNTVIGFESSTFPELQFQPSYDPSLPEIEADKDKLHQVLLNLTRNASEASPLQGRVKVRTRHCSPWELAGTNLDPGLRYVLVSIEDEGAGIPRELRNSIFKPFFSTKKRGSGLGLSISFRLIKSQGGLLRCLDGEEGGACFQIFLPEKPPQRNAEI